MQHLPGQLVVFIIGDVIAVVSSVFRLSPLLVANFFFFFGETCLNAINQFGAGSSKDARINSSEILYQRMENALRFS